MNEDKVIQEILGLKEDVRFLKKTMVTRADYQKHTELLEGIASVTKKTQDDHVFTVELYKRLQSQVDKQEDEIKQIKRQLKMA